MKSFYLYILSAIVFSQTPGFATFDNEDKMKWTQYLSGYDYVWTYGVPQNILDELQTRAAIVAESEKTKIWKLNK